VADLSVAAARPAARMPDGAWVVPPLLVLAALFFYPLSLILRQALGGEEGRLSLVHFGEVIGSRLFLDGLHHTLVIAVSATAGCLLLGFILSLIIAFVPFPGARLVGRLIDTFIACRPSSWRSPSLSSTDRQGFSTNR
jgi:2-aminoethylphosphonate transport system permease protein